MIDNTAEVFFECRSITDYRNDNVKFGLAHFGHIVEFVMRVALLTTRSFLSGMAILKYVFLPFLCKKMMILSTDESNC